MSWGFVEGNWKQFRGKVKAQWGKHNGGQFDVVVGERVELTDMLREAPPEERRRVKEAMPPRRVVLRGALAVGCSLFVPIALFGCDSKKGANPTSAAPASPPATSAEPVAPAETGKATQASVQYQAQPKGKQKCDGCMHFIAESNTCNVVDGQVGADGWCSLWAKKA